MKIEFKSIPSFISVIHFFAASKKKKEKKKKR